MQIIFNNQKIKIEDDPISIGSFIEDKGYINGCFAVMHNGNFVPKSKHNSEIIQENDEINIITPMQGG